MTEAKAEVKAEKPKKDKAIHVEGSAQPHNERVLSPHVVPSYESTADAQKAAADEAEAAGVAPGAVFHVAPDGGSSGAD